MTFNFNDQDLEKAGESKVFNNGKAGRVENVSVSMEKLGTDYESDSPNAPKYRVLFEDGEGRKINRACFKINSADYPDQWGRTYEQAIKKEWAYLAKIAEHTKGVKPMSFTDADGLFEQMYQSGIGVAQINIFVNYGSTSSPKDRLDIRKWLPAVEAAGTTLEETKLRPGSFDQMDFVAPDSEEEDAADDDMF